MLDQLALVAAIPSPVEGRWWHIPAIWEGGLGIPGGIAAGVLAGVLVARHRGLPVPDLLDVVAPALPVAQAIGRLGNWFNQELYGRPTALPWALREASSRRARPGRVSGRGSAPHESR